MGRPRVILADDHAVLLEGLVELLTPEFEVVGTVADGRELLSAAEKLQPDVVVADISMPVLNGIEAARRLKKSRPGTGIVFLTMHRDASLLKQALRVGGLGYVLKRSAVHELRTAVRKALAGQAYVSPAIVEVLGVPLPVFLGRRERASKQLTPRQREVLQLVAEGKSLKETASVLGIAPKTAEFHKYRIMQALGLRTTADLIRYALTHGVAVPE